MARRHLVLAHDALARGDVRAAINHGNELLRSDESEQHAELRDEFTLSALAGLENVNLVWGQSSLPAKRLVWL